MAKGAARFAWRQLSGFEECRQRVSSFPPATSEYPSLDAVRYDKVAAQEAELQLHVTKSSSLD